MRCTYPQPDHETEFEILCLRLLQAHWGRPMLERYARKGEDQDGVDILDVGGTIPIWAAQCKLHEPGKTLPPREIKAEVEKARRFDPPLGHYAILTTGKVSGQAQKAVRQINAEHKERGLFQVELITWDKFQELLHRHQEVAHEFYRTISGTQVAEFQGCLDSIRHSMATRENLAAAIKVAVEGVAGGLRDDPPGQRLAEAIGRVERHEYQVARALLTGLRERWWAAFSGEQRYRLLVNLAAVAKAEQKYADAGRLLLEATSYGAGEDRHAVNEAVAYELLGDRDRAFAMATEARARFPHSGLLLSIRIRTAPDAMGLDLLEAEVPEYLAGDAEVAMSLACRAGWDRDHLRIEAWARRAIDAGQQHPGAFSLLGRSLSRRSLAGSRRRLGEVPVVHDRCAAEEAREAFTEAIRRAKVRSTPEYEAEALLGRAAVAHGLGEPDAAEDDLVRATFLMPDNPEVLFAHGTFLHAVDRQGQAVTVLRRAVAAGGEAEATIALALALAARAQPGDRHEAVEVLLAMAGDPARDRREDALRAAITIMIAERRHEEAGRALDEVPELGDGGATSVLLRAKVCLAGKRPDEATPLADTALRLVGPEASWTSRRELALLLMGLGRHHDALAVWQDIVAPKLADPDVGYLIECAAHAGRHGVILEAGRAARLAGFDHDYVHRQELAVLEVYDPDEAIRILRARLDATPDDRSARLNLAHLLLITGQPLPPEAEAEPLPLVDAVTPHDGFLVVSVLRWRGKAEEARRYAYELVRRHPNEPDAHRALHVAVLGLTLPGPEIATPEVVARGTAVKYAEEGDPAERWLIVEDGPDPNALLHEFGPDHPLVGRLIGKRAGDDFLLASGCIRDRVARILAICDKSLYRARESWEQWQVRFPGEPGMELVRFRPGEGEEPRPDLGDVFRSLDRRRDDAERVEASYRSDRITIQMFANALGERIFEVVDHILLRPGLPLHGCPGDPASWSVAMATIGGASGVVIDAVAIQTLMMLDLDHLLRDWAPRLVVSQATVREIATYIEVVRMSERDHFVVAKADVGYVRTPIDGDTRRAQRVRYEELLGLIRSSCEVRDGRALAAFDPERREEMVGILGRHGAESVVLAAETGYPLWTDDGVLGLIASQEFGVRRVWTQVALLARTQAEGLSVAAYHEAVAKLIGWCYEVVRFDAATIVQAGRLADWDVDGWPLTQCLDVFADEKIPLAKVLTVAAETIVAVHRHVDSPVGRDLVTIGLVDRIGSRQIGPEAVRALAARLPQHFRLNVVREAEASQVIAAWLDLRRHRLRPA